MKPEPPTGTVLIVDDHPTNIGLLLDYLSDSGLKVLVAQDGLGALELVDYASPDIILLDVMMPGLDGFETCRRLKQKQATHDIPVIFMTALSETVGATLCLALRDAVEQAVGHGVPREAAMDFMLGHINIELAIAFGAFPEGKPIAQVWASQFDWRFQYPGADGVLGTMDDFESAHDFVVPAGEPVKFILRSRDVIHSFSVPQFRLKQDAMPGMAIPVWFQVDEDRPGDYELICMELCGWGHYKMAGKVRALPRAEYDAWVADQQAQFMSNGIEE